jgi:hypothetical protein
MNQLTQELKATASNYIKTRTAERERLNRLFGSDYGVIRQVEDDINEADLLFNALEMSPDCPRIVGIVRERLAYVMTGRWHPDRIKEYSPY